ncbi:MAG TPA: hypothetical protein PKD83_02135 [Ignavibacteria bacterium]|nr:hypothetical protein [Ignavibacteria bacterium]
MYIQEFLEYEISKIPLGIINLLTEKIARKNIKDQFESFFTYTTDNESAERYMKAANHKNKNIDDYKIHLSDTGNHNLVMSGIFLNKAGYRNIPIVEIHGKNFDVFGNPEIESIKEFLYNKYKAFDPKKICFFEIADSAKESKQEYECETILVTGHINTIKKKDKPAGYDNVYLERVYDYEFYDEYVSEYEKLKEENEIYKSKVIAESMNSLKEAMANGFLYKIIIDKKFAGIFAISKTFFNFYSGYYIKEEILFREFRGKSFAASAQRKMIDSLEASENDFIFGTIVPENPASLKTAYKCGRENEGKYYLINI